MPPWGRRVRGRRVAFRGLFFTTTAAWLGPHLRDLEGALARTLPELFDGTVAARLAPHLDPYAGPGVAVALGQSLPRGSVVDLYFGDVLDSVSTPRGDYVLDLGRVRRGGRTFRLFVDGARRIGGADAAAEAARSRISETRRSSTTPARAHRCTGRIGAQPARVLSLPLCGRLHHSPRWGGGAPPVELRTSRPIFSKKMTSFF